MNIDPTQTRAGEILVLNERERFFLLHVGCLRKVAEKVQDLEAVTQIPAGELPDDKGMALDLTLIEEIDQFRVEAPEMINPNGSIDKHQRI